MSKKVGLVILDGWGIGKKDGQDAVSVAKTPFVDSLYKNALSAELRTDGEHVGLPTGQMGNSEVGHMNIGAGRVVYQDLVKINKSIESEEFYQNSVLMSAFEKAIKNNTPVHFMGLVSNGGVHSSLEHLKALCTMAKKLNFQNVFIHAFTDGRDTDPDSGKDFLDEIELHCKATTGKIVSTIGRYYAMDRDKRWERVRKAYDLLVHGKGRKFKSADQAIAQSYEANVSDEFIEPCIIGDGEGRIKEGDVVICFNFRTDRCREITEVLTQKSFPEEEMSPLNLHYVTMTKYDETFKNVNVVFEKDNLQNTLGEVLSAAGLTQVRIAETEKYPHVTFFFSGGSFCLNFANPDMVGHTGVFESIIKACETTDKYASEVSESALKHGYELIIIADHGNAEQTQNEDGSKHTAHTTNPVPIFLLGSEKNKLNSGKLADIAPTVLSLLGVPKPEVMTGESLV